MTKFANVNQVLRSSTGQFARNQAVPRDVSHGNLLVHHTQFRGFIGLIEGQTRDVAEDVDTKWCDANLKYRTWAGEIGNRCVRKIRAVLGESLIGC